MDRQTLRQMREERILSSLDKLGFASRTQLQRIHNLGGDRNACRVLNAMSDYLNSFRDVENIYYLNKIGAERIGSERVLSKNQNYKHTLMRNDLYIHFGQPNYWKNEQIIEIPNKLKIICDAFFKDKMGRPVFAEIDNLQKMIENHKKINNYKQLKDAGDLQKRFGNFPRLVWLTTSEVRRDKLKLVCDKFGLKHEIFLVTELS